MGFTTNYVHNWICRFLGMKMTRPLLFSYYITHRCPLECVFCSDGEGRPFKEDPCNESSTDEVKKLFRVFKTATDTVDITGGGTFSSRRLDRSYEICKINSTSHLIEYAWNIFRKSA